MVFTGLLLAVALAQFEPGPAEYYAQCRTLYDKQVLAGARAACELSLVADPKYAPALKLLARIHLDEGNIEQASDLLDRLQSMGDNSLETRTLKARLLLVTGRPAEALGLVGPVPGPEAARVKGRALEALGRFREALKAYRDAAVLGEPRARIDAARLLERMGDPQGALEEIADLDDPTLLPLRGRLLWVAGRLPEAARVLERAVEHLGSTEPQYTETLRTLALVYYGMGDLRRGALVLGQMAGGANLATALLSSSWLWLLGLVILVGLHLYGESRIEPVSALEVQTEDGWGVGRVYAMLLLAWLLGATATELLGWSLYRNWLAAFTPVQEQLVRPVFYIVAALVLAVFGWGSIQPQDASKEGNEVPEPRVGRVDGLWIGTTLLAVVLTYAWISKQLGGLAPMPFLIYRPLGALAIAALALAEPMLRVRLPASLRLRYGAQLTPALAVLASGLFLISPVLLWWAVAAILLAVQLRIRNHSAAMMGWAVLAVLLLVGGYLPWVRTLF